MYHKEHPLSLADPTTGGVIIASPPLRIYPPPKKSLIRSMLYRGGGVKPHSKAWGANKRAVTRLSCSNTPY